MDFKSIVGHYFKKHFVMYTYLAVYVRLTDESNLDQSSTVSEGLDILLLVLVVPVQGFMNF